MQGQTQTQENQQYPKRHHRLKYYSTLGVQMHVKEKFMELKKRLEEKLEATITADDLMLKLMNNYQNVV